MDEIFLSPYNHLEHEDRIYKEWESSGSFKPKGDGDTFCIIMPPPNANGSLHAGHALFVAIEDLMTRYARMKGMRALWVPGADHAGFETQIVYEKKLDKEGRSRFQLSREEFYKELLDFTMSNKSHMENQLKKLGSSCDWDRELFTLDDRVIEQVYATFKKMYDDKLIYRGLRSVNWCSKHQTAFSDLELVYKERDDKFYYLQYGPFVIGTARPETKFGDKYVVVHPDDERYKQYKHGDVFEAEWINGPIKATLIKDEAGNPEMGSGAMTITPWHSAIDYEIAQRHNLEYEQIIDNKGKLLPIAGEFEGMNIKEAREKIVEKLDKKGLLVKVDDKYNHSVPVCYKCEREVEPQLKEQWFIKMESLAKDALKAIQENKITFATEKHRKTAIHWLENTKDWNISRQIVWGIRIPAKLCTECSHGMVDLENKITKCEKCGGAVKEDEDTFDTWFSSGQWPYIALGYPDSKDFKDFYPTTVMETGEDILFFWVLRMVMLGIYRTGDVPFKEIFLHGIVLDEKGKKMSKSKGNVVDPLDLAEKYGTDALRLFLVISNPPGVSFNLSENSIRGYKKFCNKVWNIARFVFSSCEDDIGDSFGEGEKKYIEEFNDFKKDITKDMESDRYHLASEKIYHYIWHTFADVIIEESKDKLTGERKHMLLFIFSECIKMLHPFAPYITECIWEHFPDKYKDNKQLINSTWPQ